jgi:hypothetical protein
MVSKAQKIRQPEGIKLLPEIAFFRNVPTDLPLLPPLLAAVLDCRWGTGLRLGGLSRVTGKVQNRSEFEFGSFPSPEWFGSGHGIAHIAISHPFSRKPADVISQ